jgi:hypothetical protein
MTSKHIQAPEEDPGHGEEITRQHALRLDAQEPPPASIQAARSGPAAAGAEDPPHGRLADVVAKAGQLAVHLAVYPCRVLSRQPQHQGADLLASRRAARPARVGPLAGDQTAAPRQQGSRRKQPSAAQPGWQQASQRGQYRPVGPVRPGPGHPAAETITSCRNTRISASLNAWLRPSRTSQPKTRTMTKYSRRKDTNRDHASTPPRTPTAAQSPRAKF